MARDQPIQSYYPSARVRIGIRFEDFGATDVPAPPVKPPQLRKGKSDAKAELEVVESEGGGFTLLAPGDDPSAVGSPQQQRKSADNRTHWIDGIIPQTASLQYNGIRTADTLKLDVLYRDMPFDPRVIRSCAVQFFLGTVSAEEYQRGINGELRAQATPSGSLPFHVIPDETIDQRGGVRSNLRFEGWVDDWESNWSGGDAPMIRLNCTDNTRILIEQDAPPRLTITPKKEIDRAIAEYLANFPQFRGISVLYQPTVDRSQIPKIEEVGKKFRPELGPNPSGKGGGKLTVWDYLTDVAGALGHVVRFQGSTVIIQRPRTLYDNSLPARADDTFQPRKLPSGRVLDRRLYLYGRNIDSLTFKRQFATHPATNIEVRCYDTTRKTTVIARYPEKDGRQSRPLPGNSNDQKWKVIEVRWPPDETVLKIIAQSAYEQIGRQEIVTQIVTKNLGSFGGGNLDPDALDCQPGDAIDVETYRGNEDPPNTVAEIEEQIRTRAAGFLKDVGYTDPELGKAYQEAINNVGLQTTFRVKTVAFDWNTEDGITIDFELINFIEVRADAAAADIDVTVEGTAPNDPVDVIVEDEVQE